jgi:phospholipid/cholesterol/gamma-HCH transport system substrate-binding protein
MELDFSKKEKIVGTFIISVAILLLVTIIIIGRGKDWFKKYIAYYTVFDESYNIQADTSVKLFNTEIGKVKNITLVGDKVEVNLKILDDFRSRIRANSIATVKSPTLIGSEYISIIPGSKDAPLIPVGGEIPSRPGKSISNYMEEFQVEKTAKMIVEAAQEVSKIVKTLRDPKGPLFEAFQHANKTLAHLETITRDISSGKGTVGGIIKSRALLDHIHRNLDKVGDDLAALEKIETGVLENIPTIKKIVKDVEEAVETLKLILANFEKGSCDIPKVTRTAAQGIHEIRVAVDKIDHVVTSLKKNFLIQPNLPQEPEAKNVDAGLRP